MKLTIMADKKLTRTAPYSKRSPKRATTLPCFSLSPLTAPDKIPIEEKLANETKNTETMPNVLGLNSDAISDKFIMATNSFVTIFVAIIPPAETTSDAGIPIIKANGAKT